MKSEQINLYDFDGTIYDGDSALEFYFFCLRKRPTLIFYFPFQSWHFLLWLLRIESRTSFKSNFFRFLKRIEKVDEHTAEFWQLKRHKIRSWYIDQDHSKDVIVSASPEFLLRPISEFLKAKALVSTLMDPKTGKIQGQNCYGEEKVIRLKALFPQATFEKAYTNNLSDTPMLNLAKKKYMVKSRNLIEL